MFAKTPEYWILGLHEASIQGIEVTLANLFRKGCLGIQPSPKVMLHRQANVDFSEFGMFSADRRSRRVQLDEN